MTAEQSKAKHIQDFRPGDTVRVSIRVVEGESERVQAFEGTVISRRGQGDSRSFTIRKISFGVGVERTFPLISPHIEKIEVVRSGRARRARLYYLRGLSGRAARLTQEERSPSKDKDAVDPSHGPSGLSAASSAPPHDGAPKHLPSSVPTVSHAN